MNAQQMIVQDQALVLSMAGKILAAIAGSSTNPGSQEESALRKARDIWKKVISETVRPENQNFFDQMRNSIAETAATIYAAQLAVSGSAIVPSDDVTNAVTWAVELALKL